MKDFETFFSNDAIVKYLCKLRAKVANNRNKKHLIHLLTESHKYNYHLKEHERLSTQNNHSTNEYFSYNIEFLNQLNDILPPRKKWINLGKQYRYDKRTGQLITSQKRNEYSLIKTIKASKINSPQEPWLIALDNFICDVQKAVSSTDYEISPPIIYPKLKSEMQISGDNECRPICLFKLKDRIILSITNKYFTKLFDDCFEDCSYAFRSKKNKSGDAVLCHHDCISDLLHYRHKHLHSPLWVTECDMEKFFDTVNHKLVKVLFDELIQKCKVKYPALNFDKPTHVFKQFLECYSFNKNVRIIGNDLTYWESYKIPNGHFSWVESEFKSLGYYDKIDDERIGIPQGGALSGLIANIMLNVADKVVLQSGAFYMRFCDDMIILHPDKTTCEVAKELYINALKGLKLVPHTFVNDAALIETRKNISKERKKLGQKTYAPYWKKKSKGPYKWDSLKNGGFPWIGFVGYEINFEGDIRVRKRSLLKEVRKQNEIVKDVKSAVKDGLRKSKRTVKESIIHRLVGMSVGRVSLRNYKEVSNALCWKNGFKMLSSNKYSIQQIKQLDRNRNKLFYNRLNFLKKLEDPQGLLKSEAKKRQLVHFNKPFSYYYQVLERKDN